jgi:hypothetical protein
VLRGSFCIAVEPQARADLRESRHGFHLPFSDNRGHATRHPVRVIIDVHTHMFTRRWLELIVAHGAPYRIQVRPDGRDETFRGGTPVVFPQPGHFDYLARRPRVASTRARRRTNVAS